MAETFAKRRHVEAAIDLRDPLDTAFARVERDDGAAESIHRYNLRHAGAGCRTAEEAAILMTTIELACARGKADA